MKRRALIALLGSAAVWPLTAGAQQPKGKTYRIGIVWANAPAASAPRLAVFQQALRELGYVEGETVIVEQRGLEGTVPAETVVGELVERKVDVILTAGTTSTRAARKVAGAIPVVMTFVSDPIGAGFVNSLARPGGNITGLTNFGPEMSVKWLELLKDLIPSASRIAVLDDAAVHPLVTGMQRAATTTGAELKSFELENNDALQDALSAIPPYHADALVVTLPPQTADRQAHILQFVAANRLPAVYWWREYVDAGGLAYYGPSVADMYRRAASYVDKILKGAKPSDLPVEQPTKFELVINLTTAKALGITVPPTLLAIVDGVIE